MSEARRNPDIFTDAEALEYLHVAGVGTDRTMERLRTDHKLPSFNIGKVTLYHRVHLDALIAKLAGLDESNRKPLRMAQG